MVGSCLQTAIYIRITEITYKHDIQVVRSLRSLTTCNCPVYFIIVISDVIINFCVQDKYGQVSSVLCNFKNESKLKKHCISHSFHKVLIGLK